MFLVAAGKQFIFCKHLNFFTAYWTLLKIKMEFNNKNNNNNNGDTMNTTQI